MSDIAKKAGVSRQALYLHFPNRTELFIAATKAKDAEFHIDARLAPSRAAKTGRERLAAFVEAWGNYIPDIHGVAKTLIVLGETDEDAAHAWAERMADMKEGCAAAVAALARDGDLRPGLTEAQATDLLWSLLSVGLWERLVRDCGWTQKAYLDEVQRLARAALLDG